MKGWPSGDIARSVAELLAPVRLESYGERAPHELSGGQRQRVALARALAPNPPVLLLDEPLGALDAKLRREMQSELRRLRRTTGKTFILVTHDQEEALTMSDTVVVMNNGKIEQAGTPEELYNAPRTAFVARFIGEMNFFDGVARTVQGALSSSTGTVRRCAPASQMLRRSQAARFLPSARISRHPCQPTCRCTNAIAGRIEGGSSAAPNCGTSSRPATCASIFPAAIPTRRHCPTMCG